MDVCLASHARCEMEAGVILGSTGVLETQTAYKDVCQGVRGDQSAPATRELSDPLLNLHSSPTYTQIDYKLFMNFG